MKAYKKRQQVWKKHIEVSPLNFEKMRERYGLASSTLKKFLDISDPTYTEPKGIEIQVTAINEYGGQILTNNVFKEVLDIHYDEDPE